MTVRPLGELLAASADVLGVPGFTGRGDWLAERLSGERRPPGERRSPLVRHIVVLLVDALGQEQLAAHAGDAPALSALADLGPLAAPFPSTTCVSLTSLGTGLPPGMHGIVGSAFRTEDGGVLTPLTWGADPNPIATQPEPTVLERAEAAGVVTTTAAPALHRDSGLTRAAMRGGRHPGADTAEARVRVCAEAIASARADGRASLTYAYWPDLDKVGHVHGVASRAYRAGLRTVDRLVADLAGLAASDVAVLVTADHGMVDVPDGRRVDLEGRPALRRDVQTILGEPRVRHVYTEPGAAGSVARTWAAELGSRALVLRRAEVAELLGPVEEWHADRIGDVVAIAADDWALVSTRVDRIVSGLRGQHGGLTDAEVLVPLRAALG